MLAQHTRKATAPRKPSILGPADFVILGTIALALALAGAFAV